MSTETIRRKILESARAEAEAAVGEAKSAAAERIRSARAAEERREAEAIAAARAEHQRKLDQAATAARAANRLKLLSLKTAVLDDLFARAVEQALGSRSGEYHEWLRAQVLSVANERGAIVPASDDRDAIAGILAELKRASRAAGLALADESLPLKGGFVLRGETVDCDLSLDAVLAAFRQDFIPQMAAMVFGRGEKDA